MVMKNMEVADRECKLFSNKSQYNYDKRVVISNWKILDSSDIKKQQKEMKRANGKRRSVKA